MPARTFRIGAARVLLSVDDSTTSVPSLATLTFSASAVTPTDLILNDVKGSLDTTATYQVIVALVGKDLSNKGYTIGVSSPSSGSLSITTGQGILVSVTNVNWPANFNKAICAAIFLKKNNGDFQLAEFAYIDPSNDFKHMIVAEPLLTAPSFTSTLLQSSTTDDTLGDRAPKGVTYVSLAPTTGGIQVNRRVDTVTVSPDNSADFQIATTRSTEITFQLLPNDVKDIIRASAGNYAKYTSGGRTIEEAQMSLQTAVALVTGNNPIKLLLPPDKNGKQEIRLYLGTIRQNQTAWTEPWTKTAVTPPSFTFSTVAQDALVIDEHIEIVFKDIT